MTSTNRGDEVRSTFVCGGSLYTTGGQRVDEIDLDQPRHGKTIDQMSARDWRSAEAALRAFDAGQR
jgi:hypothetical protein